MPEENEHQQCPLCGHFYEPREITKHHLVPKSRKGKITVGLCRVCHNQIHAHYTEKELEKSFGTLEELLSAPKLQEFLKWVRKRKPTSHIKTKTSKKKGKK